MDFGAILSRAWQIIWKHKVLWIFGILAGCGGTTSNSGANTSYRFSSGDRMPPRFEQFFNQFENLQDWQIYTIIGIAILVILTLAILFVVLGTIGRIGLIRGTQLADSGDERLSFGELFSEGMRYFWRVFLLNLLVGIVIAVLLILLGAAFVLMTVLTLGIGAFICGIPLVCLLIPLSWALQIVLEQANIALVTENLGIMAGLQRGWDVVRANAGVMIVMALILILGVTLIGGAIIALPLVAIIIPALGGVAIGTEQAIGGGLLVAGLCLAGYLPILLLLGGILRAYVSSAWTLTYLRLTSRPVAPVVSPVAVE